jgi:hypothetical protein
MDQSTWLKLVEPKKINTVKMQPVTTHRGGFEPNLPPPIGTKKMDL